MMNKILHVLLFSVMGMLIGVLAYVVGLVGVYLLVHTMKFILSMWESFGAIVPVVCFFTVIGVMLGVVCREAVDD